MPYFGDTSIQTLGGDITIQDDSPTPTSINHNQNYLLLAAAFSSELRAKASIGFVALDKEENPIEQFWIKEGSNIELKIDDWTPFGGLIDIESLPENTAYIRYIVRLNQDSTNSIGHLSDVRIIPITKKELNLLVTYRPRDITIAQFWDQRAGRDASGNAKRIYQYKRRSVSSNDSLQPLEIIGLPQPRVTVQPKNVTVVGGNPALLAAKVFVNEKSNYAWHVKTKKDENWRALPKGTTTVNDNLYELSYPTKPVTEITEVKVQLTVTFNDRSITTNTATITIYPQAIFSIQPKNITTCKGSHTRAEVGITPADTKIQWQVDDGSGFEDYPGANSSTFELPTEQSGSYQVRVNTKTPYGQIQSDPATIVIDPDITIIEQPKNAASVRARCPSLQVGVKGNQLMYQWEYRLADNESWQSIEQLYPGINGNTNTIRVCTFKPEVQYRVMITGTGGCSNINKVSDTATVRMVPSLDAQVEGDEIVLAGHKAYFQIDANTPSDATITWTLHKYPIKQDPNRHLDWSTNDSTCTGRNVILTIPPQPGDYYVAVIAFCYHC